MRVPLAVVSLALAGSVALAAQPPDPRITNADVERVTGATGVHLIAPMSQPGAGPGLDFARADNTLILMVNFGPAALYERARNQKEIDVGGTKMPMVLFHQALPGIGDEAFDSPPGPTQYVIYLRKGTQGATVSTYLHHGQPLLSLGQLKTLATLIASRM